jgi:hypothetical protein
MEMLSIHYDDPISFQADTLELNFADIGDQIIRNAEMHKGIWIKVKIIQFNRDYPGSIVMKDLGSFMIDQIKTRWPISQTTLMASSVPINNQIKLTLQNKTRFALSIQNLGEQVAAENHLGFLWDVHNNKPYLLNEAQQWNESDLQMLSKYCRNNALAMKIKEINGKPTLVIFDEQEKEMAPPVFTIDFALPGAGVALVHGELTTQSQDIYSTSQLAYYDSYSNTVYAARADAPPGTADGTAEFLNRFEHINLAQDGSGTEITDPQTGG